MHKSTLILFWVTFIFSAFATVLGALPVPAADANVGASELDVVLDGFDDETEKINGDMDDILGGLDDSGTETIKIETAKREETPFVKKIIPEGLTGKLTLSTSIAFAHDAPEENEPDNRGITRLNPGLFLEYETGIYEKWKFTVSGKTLYNAAYEINGRGDYPDILLDDSEFETELKEMHIQGPLFDGLDVKMGRQIVVWGKSDNIRVTDVLNPMDNREPGITDIEDLRLPTTMMRMDYYTETWNLTGVVIPEILFPKNPVSGSEYYPVIASALPHEKPESDFSSPEWGLSLRGFFTGWDMALYAAEYFDDNSHLEAEETNGIISRAMKHAKLTMFGGALAAAYGSYLIKAEAACINGLAYYATGDDKKSRLDVLVGMEYEGFTDTTLSVETVNRHIFDYEEAMSAAPDMAYENFLQTVFRYNGDFKHDTLHVTGILSLYGALGQKGVMSRFSVEYDVNDSVSVLGGVAFYESGDHKLFLNMGENDRLYFEAAYSF